MPGAHFYVDQHVSRGRFGREPPLAPTFVYDPNVLQSRYGFNGILSQFLPNGKLQRFGTGIVDHRQNGVVLLQQKSTSIFSCMVNIAKGKQPFKCLSATFDQIENKCLLYGPGSSADGSVRLVGGSCYEEMKEGFYDAKEILDERHDQLMSNQTAEVKDADKRIREINNNQNITMKQESDQINV
uniref:Apple domain-containing protein n=1 Tax=Meloidogyne javanica TaxID=6303 RepID=A0A915N609_MELJA